MRVLAFVLCLFCFWSGNAQTPEHIHQLLKEADSLYSAKAHDLMQLFYAQLKKGNTKDEALRNAKSQYLKKFRGQRAHPFFWAGFIGIGDMQEIANEDLQTKN